MERSGDGKAGRVVPERLKYIGLDIDRGNYSIMIQLEGGGAGLTFPAGLSAADVADGLRRLGYDLEEGAKERARMKEKA